jgi:hypothetical protein
MQFVLQDAQGTDSVHSHSAVTCRRDNRLYRSGTQQELEDAFRDTGG